MQVLLSWLKDYVKIDKSEQELADILSLSGTSVDAIIRKLDDNIVVGEIKEILPHPNADRLQIAKVNIGLEELQIVCGAPNIQVGQKVPLALVGTKLKDFEIKKAEIRGVESFGMMCSDTELGFGDDHSGIKILPDECMIGEKLNKYLTGDSILDIEITPNRGDCLSHLGVAREIAVNTNKKMDNPVEIELTDKGKKEISVNIENFKLCPQYSAILIKNVKIGPSPEWLINRLNTLGAKSINNIVDITNYIMLDWGQPLHAFDADKIKDKKIFIRSAYKNEQIEVLDGKIIKLQDNDLVIADSEKAIALAGIMGGKNSEVGADSKDIIIESAEFLATIVRKTSKKQNISTEASYRFERGIDSGRVFESVKYAAQKVLEICGGEIEQIIYEGKEPENRKVNIEYNKINNLLGTKLSNEEINEILINLGFELLEGIAKVPSWRHDVDLWQDLAEEVGRVYGFSKIKHEPIQKTNLIEFNKEFKQKEIIKDLLINSGFNEVLNYIFLSQEDIKVANLDSKNLLEVINPAQQENKYLRNSLIPGLLKNIAKNPAFDPVLLFEIGHIFTKNEEKTKLAIVGSGKHSKQKLEKAIKELEEKFLLKLDIKINELQRDELLKYKIRKPVVFYVELDIEEIIKKSKLIDYELKQSSAKAIYRQISKYPPALRDLAIIIAKEIDSQDIIKTLYNESENVLLVELFDEFESEKIGSNNKSIALHIYLQDQNKALNEQEIDDIIKILLDKLNHDYKAKLRG